MYLLSKKDYHKVSGGNLKTDVLMYTMGTVGFTLEAVAASALVGYLIKENSAYANVSKSSFVLGVAALSTVAYSEYSGYSHLGDLYDTYKKVKQVQNFFNFWG